LAASVAALPPPESVPEPGGPTVPVWTTKLNAAKLPLLSVDLIALRGFEHDTGMAFPKARTVG
jgi:hypothetical protein